MTSVQEVQMALLETLSELAQNHGTILANDSPVKDDPSLRQFHIQQSMAKVTVAKLMCARAGCDEEEIGIVVRMATTRGSQVGS